MTKIGTSATVAIRSNDDLIKVKEHFLDLKTQKNRKIGPIQFCNTLPSELHGCIHNPGKRIAINVANVPIPVLHNTSLNRCKCMFSLTKTKRCLARCV